MKPDAGRIPARKFAGLDAFRRLKRDGAAYYGLPKDVQFCRRCVISNQRPNSAVEYQHTAASLKSTIHFDDEGVCDACRLAERNKTEIDWTER